MGKLRPTDETVHELANHLGEQFPFFTGLSGAVIGYTGVGTIGPPRLVYSGHRIIREFQRINEWSEEDAREWADYNTFQAGLGEQTPVVVFPIPPFIIQATGERRS
jgi:hypothetical protein